MQSQTTDKQDKPSRWYLSTMREDGLMVSPEGRVCVQAAGLSDLLDTVHPVMAAMRAGAELSPALHTIAPQLALLFNEPLQIVLVGQLMLASADAADHQEIHEVAFAKPSEALLAAVAAIRACERDEQVVV